MLVLVRVYFSEIEYCKIKAWKKHIKMQMNLVVPVGLVKFVFYEEKEKFFQEFILGLENYCRLSVPPGFGLVSKVWIKI